MTTKPGVAPKPEAHALLGASSAYRILHCPPSARLCETLPDTESTYAVEGGIAHELAALRLQQCFDPKLTKRAFGAACAKLLKRPEAGADMDGAVNQYVDAVRDAASRYASAPFVAIEERVAYDDVAPEGFGTCDCLLIGRVTDGLLVGGAPDRWALHLFDYKHGKGMPVNADHNPQLMLYALGALRKFGMIYPIDTVTLTICQPRLDAFTDWTTTPAELEAWAEMIRPTMQLAFEGKGEFAEGDWCRFCRAGVRCKARAQAFTALEDFGYRTPISQPLLTDAELGQVLGVGERLQKWLDQLRDYALSLLLGGGELPGWKVVAGRSTRAFADQAQAFTAAQASGVDAALLYKRQPITLTELEKIMGEKAFGAALEGQIVRAPGKPALVPETDPRPALSGITAAEDFGGTTMESE